MTVSYERYKMDPRDREALSAALALLNHRLEEFEVWLGMFGNMCNLCADLTAGESLFRENSSVYIIGGPVEGGEYPHGIFCVTHGMLAWQETKDSPTLCTVSGEVEEAPKKTAPTAARVTVVGKI